MLYVKPVPDADILFTFVTVYLSVFFSFSYCLPVCGEIKLYTSLSIYRRVYDLRHLQADCQEPGSAPEPYARLLLLDWAVDTTDPGS